MAPRRRRCANRVPKDDPQEGSSKDNVPKVWPRAPVPFTWTLDRSLALLFSMIGRKPAGIHKHANMLLIKAEVSERLQMDVPIKEIWKFLNAHWDMRLVDKLESQVTKFKSKAFELPKTEEWAKLIEEEGKKVAEMEAIKAAEASLVETNNVDITKFKTLQIRLERMDSNSDQIKMKMKQYQESNNTLETETTLKDILDVNQSTSTNTNTDNNIQSNTIDFGADNNLENNNEDNPSSKVSKSKIRTPNKQRKRKIGTINKL